MRRRAWEWEWDACGAAKERYQSIEAKCNDYPLCWIRAKLSEKHAIPCCRGSAVLPHGIVAGGKLPSKRSTIQYDQRETITTARLLGLVNHPRLHHTPSRPKPTRTTSADYCEQVTSLQLYVLYLTGRPRTAVSVFFGDRHGHGSATILQAQRFGAFKSCPFGVLVLCPRWQRQVVSAQATRPRPAELLRDVIHGACWRGDAFKKRSAKSRHGTAGWG